MAVKHQSKCYRTFKGVEYVNYADLVYSDAENEQLLKEAKRLYVNVKSIMHHTREYRQVFVNELRDYTTTKDIAILIANKVNMPYCWEDISQRLEKGIALPFKLD